METSEKTEKRWQDFDEVLRREQQDESEEVLAVRVGQEVDGLVVSETEDEEKQGCTPLITACCKGMTEVVQELLKTGADVTLCDGSQRTALHVSPPALQRKVLGWMSRPHLPPQTQLLQASWQGDLHSLQQLLAQADRVDVNLPNSDSVTALMLAVRDIDLFESIMTPLPWDHSPVEVVKELLGLSAKCLQGALLYLTIINISAKSKLVVKMAAEVSDEPRDSRGLSLPSLGDSSRRWGRIDVAPSCGLLSTRTPCVPVTPRHRQRTRSVVAACPSSPSLLSVTEPSQLSQSAPSIMEPLLCSHTMMQARAHIQSRLGSQDTVNEQRFTQGHLPALHPRTPKLLAPLTCRPRDSAALPALKHHVPLKPINQSPLCSRTRLRRERLSWGSLHTGPMTATKGGSEESGSSSSNHSSIDLEDDETDIEERASEDGNLKFAGNRLQHSKDVEATEADLVVSRMQHFKVQSRIGQIPQVHKSTHTLTGKPTNDEGISLNTEKALSSHYEGKATHVSYTKVPVDNHAFTNHNHAKQGDSMKCVRDTVKSEISVMSYCDEEEKEREGCITDPETDDAHAIIFDMNDEQVDAIACSKGIYIYELHVQKMKETMKDSCDEAILHSAQDAKLNTSSAVGKTQLFAAAVNHPLSDVDPKSDKQMLKALNPAQCKDTRTSMKCELRANNQSNKSSSFNPLVHKEHSIPSRTKSKGNLKYSSLSTQGKDKTRKSPELIISGEATACKVKSRVKSVKGAHRSTDTPSPRKKVIDHPQSKRANEDKLNNSRAQPPVRELKSARQLKRLSAGGAPRSKSAVDFITYKDMFQQLQSRDEGPAIYEMFAGPIYDNLRVSSSCEKTKDRQVQSAETRKIPQPHKVKHRPLKQPQCKMRRSPGESMVLSAKNKARLVSSRVKPHLTPVSRKGYYKTDNVPKPEAKLDLSKDGHNRAQEKAEDDILSTIEEALSTHGSETLKSDDKTLIMTMNMQEVLGNSSAGNLKRQIPESVLPHGSQQPKINTWTSSGSSGSPTVMSPVYQKFLDEVGDGPLTDDLLQCLAEELISLDERDVSIGPCAENQELSKKESKKDDHVSGTNMLSEVISADGAALLGSGLAVDDTISWTKGEVLGRGAYGTVYCGLTSQGQLVAVKQVNLDTSDSDTAKREYNRLQGEVELLKTLRHTNIVGFLGTSLYQHVVSIFMEYIPGGSIASILHRFGPLPERVLALYTHQILEGVAYLHLNRVIHRDLKGNNVMLMPTGVIKLIDFGCARRLSCLTHTASNSGDLLKSVHGTPYWMAPEVINETGYGRKSDIWSVGCTVFEMATGKPPLAHMDKMAALFYIGAQRGLMPSLPEGFSDNAKDFVKICFTSLEQEVADEEGGWWLWLASGYTLLREADEDKEVDPGGASGVPSMPTKTASELETVAVEEAELVEGMRAEVVVDAYPFHYLLSVEGYPAWLCLPWGHSLWLAGLYVPAMLSRVKGAPPDWPGMDIVKAAPALEKLGLEETPA
ncbi:hypothetical protein INR49_025231, partial [Caranx melampygus]